MNSKKNLKRNLLICLLAGSAVMYTLPLHAATSVIGNGTLPSGGQFFDGNKFTQGTVIENGHNFKGIGSITKPNDLTMNVHQNNQNAVIKWDSFNVGGSATVNFTSDKSNFNTLNYVNGGNASQIYGTINAQGGNIFVVNPAGVQIGNSAQINVGSLYVSNKNLDNVDWKAINDVNPNINSIMGQGTTGDAALMSLGNINAGEVTFEGNGRIVIDSERLLNSDGNSKNTNFEVHTDDAGNVLIGYDAYVDTDKDGDGHIDGYKNQDRAFNQNVFVNGQNPEDNVKGYMWVEDVKQLQAINTNLSGNYALRNSIDATATSSWNDEGTNTDINEGFKAIGINENGYIIKTDVNTDNGLVTKNGFYGKFDGLDYNIFGLTINRAGENNVGLFGVVDGANINNVTLVGGSITGKDNVGAIVGNANNTTLTNVVNSAAVSGDSNVGGIVGIATDTTVEDAINTGAIEGIANTDNGGINVGGLIGSMNSSHLIGNSYNLGDVSGDGYNVGGLVGSALNSTIGNPSEVNGKPVENVETVYNRMDVTGAYNVGGIVGNMVGSTVQNAENSGNVTASGYDKSGNYTYHKYNGTASPDVNIANVGGIAGSSSSSSTGTVSNIIDAQNTGDVTSSKVNNQEYYVAGNVGGIVGSAVNTNITNATNKENDVRGAHNVGGVAGYFGGSATTTGGINDGGDIMATGARDANGFVTETVRPVGDANESFIIGNIGGVVGYLDGDNVYVTGSANRGTVHTDEPADPAHVEAWQKAANVGGVVGKIDRGTPNTLDGIKKGNEKAAVTNSYNTGDVLGYTGVGGVIGMMYNGSVAGSYNQGAINTTRQVDRGGGSDIDPLNMGGIVGDTTEQTSASAVIYDVYNEGQIGDEDFEFYARHVGGIVGRLSGTVEKAYNTGDIYNNDTAVGGIVGWWYNGNIKNVFNTGNITVRSATELQVGGIAGAAETEYKTLENAYNLGTIRGYKERVDNLNNPLNGIDRDIYVGGIIGRARGRNALTIKNVYTMGNLYAGVGTYNDATGTYSYKHTQTNGLGAIYGGNEAPTLQGANYIIPDSGYFANLSRQSGVNDIRYSDRYKKDAYEFVNVGTTGDIFSEQKEESGAVEGATDYNWRIYQGSTTPILNAFLPNVEDYFDDNNNMTNINTIQYGTAYNPLLTIIKANGDLSYDWNKLGISGAASLAVYGGGLTLDNVDTSSGNGYYSGLLYTDKDLTLIATNKNNEPDETKVSGDIGLGSGAELYGSSVKIEADGTVTVYGSVTATGETADLTGDINITAGDVDVYGTLTTGKPVSIAGIEGSAQKVDTNFENVNNPNEAMIHISERFAHEINSANGATSNITINAGTKLVVGDDGKPILDAEGNKQYVNIGDGNVNLYFGNKEHGLITTGGDLTVTGTGDVYVDSDLDIGGDLTLEGTGADSEVVLDITNIGQVQAKNELAENTDSKVTAAEKLHEFMHHFENTNADTNNLITLNSASGDAKLAVDMWDGKKFDLEKFDTTDANGTEHEFKTEIDSMNVTVNGEELGEKGNKHVKDYTYIWVSDGDQLKGIQQSVKVNNDFLDFNFALKNDINASDIGNGYEAIDGTTGYNGTFDGRGNRIIGLTVSGDNAGIFSTVGEGGVVKDVNIYSGTFTGSSNAGAVAGENKGRIEGIVTFGNTVTVTGNGGNAGGIAGTNSGTVDDVESTGSVIAGGSNAQNFAGGLVGTNNITGIVNNSFSNSAVTASSGNTDALGGVVGVNSGEVSLVDSLGITNGGAHYIGNVGGIIGTNSGKLNSAYNESIVSGYSNVGGIIGNNSGTISNIVNASSVDGLDINPDVQQAQSNYVGGLVGSNSGSVTNGRNNGTITGTNYVGGMVGSNAQGATLTNLVNDSSAAIEGEQYVGGIAGSNAGKISATDDSLINRGSITGQKYVGGVAGVNQEGGIIENTISSIALHVKTPYTNDSNIDNDPMYFGGVVGQNSGTINGATNKSSVEVAADGATLVGGIIGQNTKTGTLQGEILNQGKVSGASDVGGIIGENQNASLLNNQTKDEHGNIIRLQITNEGNVSATKGGAAGIFYKNNITGTEGDVNANAINNVDIINKGTVTGGKDDDSITGGLFGINTGNITNSTLTNTGKVTGGGTVGGLIGNNSGSASGSVFTNDGIVEGEDKVGGLFGINSVSFNTSSLINTVNAQVTGRQEVGGLIGDNRGNITGGRDAADSYYKYQIYNNGTINVTEEGTHIGGLFGTNNGTVKAAYNTGVINAGQSSNVGGIAGVNEQGGKLDQVFNTVMTGVDDEGNTVYGTITGKDNVGGLVGTNSGTLSNAYNTTDVSGTTNVGNAVGRNEANATVNNVYDVNNTGNRLIAENNGNVTGSYSGNEADKKTTGITYVAEGDKLKEDSYKDSLNDADTWKFYDGNSNPLLKVFLTDVEIKVDVDEINEYINNVYNGNAQAITDEDIDKLIAVGAITAPDNFAAYNNAKELINSISHTNAGEYSDWLYSQQIASNGNGEIFNPNNLGYNIALTADIDTAKLTINLGEVTHIYGAPNTNGYNYTVEGWINPDDANDYTITIGTLGNGITDNALKDNNIHTNDVDEYTWSTTTASISANGSLNNYEIVTVKDGTSKVIPVTINVILNDVTHIYGDSFNSNDYTVGNVDWVNGDNYTTADVVLSNINDGAFTNGNGGKTNDVTADGYKWNATVSGNGANAESINKNYIFNVIDGDSKVTPKEVTIEDILASIEYGSKGDFTVENTGNINGTVYDDNLGISYTDTSVIAGSEYALNQNGRDTADVKVNNGVYTDSISINGIKLTGDKAGNYYISSDTAKGDIRVDKAQIHIGANNEAIHVGEKPDYIGTDINGALVNGDKLNGNYHYGVENSADEKVVGDHSIGVWIGNTFYDLSATVDWTKVDGFFANYNVTFVPGTLTVTEQVMPDLPDNWPNNRWDYLFGDNPFDRNKDFRERKAEVNFVDGGMEI